MKKIIFLLLYCLVITSLYSQKYTFKNNKGTYINFNTDQTIEVPKIDEITIEDLGHDKFRLKDKKGIINFQFSHIEDKKFFIYKVINGHSRIQSNVDMKLISRGKPGKFSIDTEKSAIVFVYKLGK